MLKSLNPLLTPELLYVLRAMGHGDELALVDSNFPSDSVAQETVHGTLIRLEGTTTVNVAEAIFSIFPLDSFVDHPIHYMGPVDDPNRIESVHTACKEVINKHADRDWKMSPLERYAFYERAKKAYAVVSTSERRPYGCFLFVKGVIGPKGEVV